MNFKIFVIIFGLFLSTEAISSDFCFTANTLPLESKVCGTTFASINFSGINPTSTNINSCDPTPPPDLWIHFNIPLGSNQNIMIRERSGTTITALAEVLYKNNCAPADGGCCDLAVSIGNCYSFTDAPNAIILENMPSGDYYVRVWDSLYATTGLFNVSAHKLPINLSDWVFCDESTGEGDGYVANQLIIEPATDFDPAIFNPDFFEVKSCACTDPPLLLYEASDYSAFLEGQITAKNSTCVEGTGLNFITPPLREPFSANCDPSFYCTPINQYKPINPTSKARIAIVDTGINIDHEAFENALWSNMEINDSDNCVANDIFGYDFKNEQGTPTDTDGHGTWVAGTVAEEFPDNIQLEIISTKFYDQNEGTLFDALCGMHYAIDEGASTIVTSWGFKTKMIPQFLEDVLDKGRIRDVLFIASAGNDTEDIDIGVPKFPSNAQSENMIVVASYDEQTNGLASYSNFGNTSVDLAAIGHVIAPSISNNASSLTEVDSVVGTSIAAPRVARTATIIKASFPNLSATQIKECILSTVEQTALLGGLIQSGGYLNHEKALICAQEKAELNSCLDSPLYVTSYLINDEVYATNKLIESNAYIESAATICFSAVKHIQLRPNFEIELGVVFDAVIKTCE